MQVRYLGVRFSRIEVKRGAVEAAPDMPVRVNGEFELLRVDVAGVDGGFEHRCVFRMSYRTEPDVFSAYAEGVLLFLSDEEMDGKELHSFARGTVASRLLPLVNLMLPLYFDLPIGVGPAMRQKKAHTPLYV